MDAVIARQLAHVYEEGQSAVLCMVVEESGSTPRAAGASMIVYQSGRTEGTIGGGITEHRVTGKALDML